MFLKEAADFIQSVFNPAAYRAKVKAREDAACEAKFAEDIAVLDETLKEIAEEEAGGWRSEGRLDELFADLGDNCAQLAVAPNALSDKNRIDAIVSATEKMLKANKTFAYAVDGEAFLQIAGYLPQAAPLVYAYANEFDKEDGGFYERVAELLPEEDLLRGHLSEDKQAYTGARMGSRGSIAVAELSDNGRDITYFAGCFEGGKEAFIDRINDEYDYAATDEYGVPYRVPEDDLKAKYSLHPHLKHRDDYLAFIEESEKILFNKAGLEGPTYSDFPDPAFC